MGGLSKKAYQIERTGNQTKNPYIIVDAGGLLFKREFIPPGRQDVEKITANGILDAYHVMNVNAVGIGKHDLAAGLQFLMKKKGIVPWVSCNIIKRSTGTTVFEPYIIQKVGTIKIGVVGITMSPTKNPFNNSDDAYIASWKDTLPNVLKKIAKSCDMVILLSSMSQQENTEIAGTYENIHVIIQSSPRASNMEPLLINNTLICQTGYRGKYLGRLKIDWQESRRWQQPHFQSSTTLKTELDRIEVQLKRSPNNQQMKNRKKYLLEQIKKVKVQKNQKDIKLQASRYENRFIPLEASLPDHTEVLKVVQAIKKKINDPGRLSTKKTTDVPTNRSKNIQDRKNAGVPKNYVGWPACGKCHTEQTTKWQKSRHAKSFLTLVNQRQQLNRNCIPCHITGVVTGNEPHALSIYHGLRQVSCEACHGQGQMHGINPQKHKLTVLPVEKTCKRCHTPERDPSFNYVSDMKRLGCVR